MAKEWALSTGKLSLGGVPRKSVDKTSLFVLPYVPRHEKNSFLHMRKKRRRSASRYHEADHRLCFRYTDSTIPLLPKSEISCL